MEKSSEQAENSVTESSQEETAEVVHIQEENTKGSDDHPEEPITKNADQLIAEAKDMLQQVIQVKKEDTKESDDHPEEPITKNADQLIAEARDMLQQSDNESKDCLGTLNEDMEAFESEKAKVLDGSIHKVEALLSEAGFKSDVISDVGGEDIKIGSVEPIAPIRVKSLSSGKFTAFILGLIAGLVAVVAWIYVATENLKMTLDMSKIPEAGVIDKILVWIGGGITGGEGNALMGMVILSVSGLVTMWIVYSIKVFLKESSNDRFAQKVHKDAEFYCTKKEECKREMKKVSEHINEVINSLKTYDIFFQELDARLQRVIYLEGKVPFDTYHSKSKEDMNQANLLIGSLGRLLSVSMAEEDGSLSEEAIKAMHKSNHSLELYREKLYA